MTAERRTPPADPTNERTADQSSQSASGLSGGADEAARGAADAPEHDRENEEADRDRSTDPALPADDATLNTKI